jgi:hypothetical protein
MQSAAVRCSRENTRRLHRGSQVLRRRIRRAPIHGNADRTGFAQDSFLKRGGFEPIGPPATETWSFGTPARSAKGLCFRIEDGDPVAATKQPITADPRKFALEFRAFHLFGTINTALRGRYKLDYAPAPCVEKAVQSRPRAAWGGSSSDENSPSNVPFENGSKAYCQDGRHRRLRFCRRFAGPHLDGDGAVYAPCRITFHTLQGAAGPIQKYKNSSTERHPVRFAPSKRSAQRHQGSRDWVPFHKPKFGIRRSVKKLTHTRLKRTPLFIHGGRSRVA